MNRANVFSLDTNGKKFVKSIRTELIFFLWIQVAKFRQIIWKDVVHRKKISELNVNRVIFSLDRNSKKFVKSFVPIFFWIKDVEKKFVKST